METERVFCAVGTEFLYGLDEFHSPKPSLLSHNSDPEGKWAQPGNLLKGCVFSRTISCLVLTHDFSLSLALLLHLTSPAGSFFLSPGAKFPDVLCFNLKKKLEAESLNQLEARVTGSGPFAGGARYIGRTFGKGVGKYPTPTRLHGITF
jgi:hypothetical protein